MRHPHPLSEKQTNIILGESNIDRHSVSLFYKTKIRPSILLKSIFFTDGSTRSRYFNTGDCHAFYQNSSPKYSFHENQRQGFRSYTFPAHQERPLEDERQDYAEEEGPSAGASRFHHEAPGREMSGFAVTDYRVGRGGDENELADYFAEAVNLGGCEDKQESHGWDYSGFSIDRGGDVDGLVDHFAEAVNIGGHEDEDGFDGEDYSGHAGGDREEQREPEGAGYSCQAVFSGYCIDVPGESKHVEDENLGEESGEGSDVGGEEDVNDGETASHGAAEEENESADESSSEGGDEHDVENSSEGGDEHDTKSDVHSVSSYSDYDSYDDYSD